MGPCSDGGLTTALLLLAAALYASVEAYCKVEVCSRQYARAIDNESIVRGPSYRYCTVLQSYSDCIRATGRSCRGNLDYHSVYSLVLQWSAEYNCSHIIINGPPTYPSYNPTRSSKTRPPVTKCTSYRSTSGSSTVFSHCGLFGDPHLRTFYNELQTCRVLGAWPLIDNPHLAVQVTNVAVMKGSSATATSKVTVIIRDHHHCTSEKTYEAQTDFLPGVFVDGSKSSGPGVRIQEENPGRHVEIHLRYIETRIVIRQVGHYLTFAVRMPQEIAIQGAQTETQELCVKGCPKRERIDYTQLLAHPDQSISMITTRGHVAMPIKEALATCRQYNVTDFYLDACIFDLLTTGDSKFSMAAREAMHDVLTLFPAAIASQENRTSLPPIKIHAKDNFIPENSAPGRPAGLLTIVLLLWTIIHLVNSNMMP